MPISQCQILAFCWLLVKAKLEWHSYLYPVREQHTAEALPVWVGIIGLQYSQLSKVTFHNSSYRVLFESGQQLSGSGDGWSTSIYNGNGNRYALLANPDGLYFAKYSSEGVRTEIWHIPA